MPKLFFQFSELPIGREFAWSVPHGRCRKKSNDIKDNATSGEDDYENWLTIKPDSYVEWMFSSEEWEMAIIRINEIVAEGHYQVYLVHEQGTSQFSDSSGRYEETLRYYGQEMMECLQLFVLDCPRIEAANLRRKKEKNLRGRT